MGGLGASDEEPLGPRREGGSWVRLGCGFRVKLRGAGVVKFDKAESFNCGSAWRKGLEWVGSQRGSKKKYEGYKRDKGKGKSRTTVEARSQVEGHAGNVWFRVAVGLMEGTGYGYGRKAGVNFGYRGKNRVRPLCGFCVAFGWGAWYCEGEPKAR